MPRNISSDVLTKLATQKGLEPVNIISVQWLKGGGFYNYCDRNVPGVVGGKLIEVADLEAVIDIEHSGPTTSVKVTLDDTDGTIKKIFDNNDVTSRRAVIYQWFTDVPFSEAFPIFEGVVASPIVWSEGDRSFSFDIVSKIDDVEVGFIVEDGNFVNVPSIILNKAWPIIFGTVIDMPCLQFDEIPVGVTTVPIGIPDATLKGQIGYMQSRTGAQAGRATCLSLRAAELMLQGQATGDKALYNKGKTLENQAFSMNSANNNNIQHTNRLSGIQAHQSQYDVRTIHILNGHRFKQGVDYEIKINGASYYGHFQGDVFSVVSRLSPSENVHREPGGQIATNYPSRYQQPVLGTQESVDQQQVARTTWKIEWPPDNEESAYWACQPPFFVTFNTTPSSAGEKNKSSFFFAQAGAHVSVGQGYKIRYIITIMPGCQVLWLSAKNKGGGVEVITPIPPIYYTLSYMSLGSITALIATFEQPLSTVFDQKWGNDVYATVRSPIGPNTVDILIWIIQHYTQYGVDFTSFNHVRSLIANYPSNFPLLSKKNVIATLKEIAWQARCAIWLANETFYLKYLPEQGTPVDTITESDIEVATLQVMSTPSEELVTKLVATYKESLAVPEPYEICLWNNIDKYGTIQKNFDFYIYNTGAYVLKSATFWSMRYSNMWKVLKCRTFLDKLTIETLDNVTVDFANHYVANEAVVGTAQKATFNSADFAIDLEIWLPVRLGEMTAYPLAYPANIKTTYVYPEIQQVAGTFMQVPTGERDLGGAYNTWSVGPGQNPRPISDRADHAPTDSDNSAVLLAGIPSFGGGGGDGGGGGSPVPSYDYDYRRPQTVPISADSTVAARNPLPATINSASADGSNSYSVTIFNQGVGKDGTTVSAIAPGLDPADVLPDGTTGFVFTQTVKDTDTGKAKLVYYFFPSAYWITPPAS